MIRIQGQLPTRKGTHSEKLTALQCVCKAVNSAERARFELASPFRRPHAFQACLFSHSSISPMTFVAERIAKLIKTFEYSAFFGEYFYSVPRLSFST